MTPPWQILLGYVLSVGAFSVSYWMWERGVSGEVIVPFVILGASWFTLTIIEVLYDIEFLRRY